MYKKHPVFEKPKDENSKIWRYLDFTKFVSLIERNALFFERLDKLGDPFEGSIPRANIDLKNASNLTLKRLEKAFGKKTVKSFLSTKRNFSLALRRCAVVNCWHINEVESAAMWKLYLKSDEGIAIQSTFKRLAESFVNYTENNVYIGKVKYIDYEKDTIPINNLFYPFVHKRKSFEHENELRAVIVKFPSSPRITPNVASFKNGIYVAIDLKKLIEKVFVSPTAGSWFGELVKSISDRYELHKDVVKSSLSKDPLF